MEVVGGHELQERIGGGITGSVWRAGQLAVKVFNDDENHVFRNEVKVLMRLDSHYLAKCLHAGMSAHPAVHGVKMTPYIVFPLYGPALNRRLRDDNLPLGVVKTLARCLFGGLSALHRSNIVHADIKPENILSNGEAFVIADFGVSVYAGERVTDTVGTPEYLAPEVILDQMWGAPYDIWSAHLVIYSALTRTPLFDIYSEYDVCYGDDVDGVATDGVAMTDDEDASDPTALAYRTLMLMVKVIGPMPNPRRARRYLDVNGQPVGGPVTPIGVESLLLQLTSDDMCEPKSAAEFITAGLQWNPDARPTDDAVLAHAWLAHGQ